MRLFVVHTRDQRVVWSVVRPDERNRMWHHGRARERLKRSCNSLQHCVVRAGGGRIDYHLPKWRVSSCKQTVKSNTLRLIRLLVDIDRRRFKEECLKVLESQVNCKHMKMQLCQHTHTTIAGWEESVCLWSSVLDLSVTIFRRRLEILDRWLEGQCTGVSQLINSIYPTMSGRQHSARASGE